MKRTLSLLLASALILGLLSACEEEGGATTLTPPPSPVTDGPSPSPSSSGQLSPSQPSPSQSAASAGLPDGPAVTELAKAAFSVSGCEAPEAVEYINAEEDAGSLDFYVENAYGLEEGEWEDAAIIRATGASAFEIAVLRCADEGAAVRAATEFMTYIFTRQGDFTGYAPDQADMAANGSVNQQETYAALFICPEPGQADAAFKAVLTGADSPAQSSTGPSAVPSEEQPSPSDADPIPTFYDSGAVPISPAPSESPVQADPKFPDRYPFEPPNEDDMSLYDTAAIRDAWAAGDPYGLSDYDRAIYDAAQKVIGETLRDGMSAYEKEAALYDWMVQTINYDWTHNDVMVPTPRESFTPYGGLVNHMATCLGFATTFQLLMDLAGVECITVIGAAYYNAGDHAWNMVRLNGSWYCVDVTWDANARERMGSAARWTFFNITSDEMAENGDHQWDYANTPEAVTAGHGK